MLAGDPAHGGKITQKTIEEARTGLAAERSGQIAPIISRGDPNFPGEEKGFEFMTQDGKKYDVKAFWPNSLSTPEQIKDFQVKYGSYNGTPGSKSDIDIIINPNAMTDSQLNTVINRVKSAGVSENRIIVPPRNQFSPINVNGEIK